MMNNDIMTLEEEIRIVSNYTQQLAETFARKRTDYGPTTTETFIKFGPTSMLVRMHDKLGRLDNLLGRSQVARVDESVEDTLLDLANYCLITLLELQKIEAYMKENAAKVKCF